MANVRHLLLGVILTAGCLGAPSQAREITPAPDPLTWFSETNFARFATDPATQQAVVYLNNMPLVAFTGPEAQRRAEETSTALNQAQQRLLTGSLGLYQHDAGIEVRTPDDQLLLTINDQVQNPDGLQGRDLAQTVAKQVSIALKLPELVALGKPVKPSPLENITKQFKEFILQTFQGRASWYGGAFNGRRSASGAIHRAEGLTAAHRSLPFGTKVKVTNLQNGRAVIVEVTDRGPFVGGRVLDVSQGAARALGMIQMGVAKVKVDVLRLTK